MDNKLGIVISNLRKEKGITQKELSEALNISDKAVSRWECGTGRPTLEMLYQISKYFNVSFNDLITARISDNSEDDKVVEAIIKEFSDIGKKRIKRVKRILLFFVILAVILSIGIIFTNTYNRFKVYKVHTESNTIDTVYGIYVETHVKDTLYLGDLKIKNVLIKENDIVSVDIYYKEKGKEYIIQNYSSLENIYLSGSQSYIKIDNLSKYFDNLYIRITIIDEKNNIQNHEGKLEFVKDFSNNKIYYDETFNTEKLKLNITSYNEKDIKEILIQNGFEETPKNVFRKIVNKEKTSYIIDSKTIYYNYENNGFSYQYKLSLNESVLEVKIIDSNFTTIQNYKYNVDRNEMDCMIGKCNDYKKVLNILDENILYLLK